MSHVKLAAFMCPVCLHFQELLRLSEKLWPYLGVFLMLTEVGRQGLAMCTSQTA